MKAEDHRPRSDEYFIQRTLNGDVQAFATLVDRYKRMVYTLAFRMLKNCEEAEEAAQDTFIKAYNGLAGFNGNSRFSTWLYRIGYFQCLDYLRRNRGPLQSWDDGILQKGWQSALPEVYEHMDQEDRKFLVHRALNLLPGEDSLILTLFYLEERSLQEIAEIMNIRQGSAKVRLHRSRKRLATLLAGKEESESNSRYG